MQVEGATTLNQILTRLDAHPDPETIQALLGLAELLHSTKKGRNRVWDAFTIPITLRSRVVYDAPDDRDWWERIAVRLKRLGFETPEPGPGTRS